MDTRGRLDQRSWERAWMGKVGQGDRGVETTAEPRSQRGSEGRKTSGRHSTEHFVQPSSSSPALEQTPPSAARKLGINLSVLVN